ncbi:helix-turn-helix domain-containing protein [Natronorubrum daqingense]|uniref:Uncharacterized protein n=1 Tax=Natronorubrum daqingense TaxID=588898 RepID=A0A1N7G1T5_9EURY|nr:helix-turn-helix domain-containing protein [Natronorubrum daqingense]APX98644.1 hypothetical protein BB347_18305 [Natronorubrum daqingense]SIS06590.1 hypothetical protein SAMN05421809_3678 [Natronorubrum daqingense]
MPEGQFKPGTPRVTEESRKSNSETNRNHNHNPDHDCDRARERVLDDLPPSAKLVYKVLEYEGEQSLQQLAAESRLPKRTIRYAIAEHLKETGVVDDRSSLEDARRSLFFLTDPESDTAPKTEGSEHVA